MIGIDKCGGVKELRSLLYLGAMSYVGRLPDIPRTQKDAWLIKIMSRDARRSETHFGAF